MVEIEILSACSHEHIVGLLETYLFNSKLWVSHRFVQVVLTGFEIRRVLASNTLKSKQGLSTFLS